RPPPRSPSFPYPTLFRSETARIGVLELHLPGPCLGLRALLRFHRGNLLLRADPDAGQQGHDLTLDLLQHVAEQLEGLLLVLLLGDRKSTRLNSSHVKISY